MDKTESDPCMKFSWHYIHNTFEKNMETCQSTTLLYTDVGLSSAGYRLSLPDQK